jgi:hypothetical protein
MFKISIRKEETEKDGNKKKTRKIERKPGRNRLNKRNRKKTHRNF